MSTTTATRERPILFTASMVRAILTGTKTQTRRLVKWPRGSLACDCSEDLGPTREDEYGDPVRIPYPYGIPGDRLWVRESFRFFASRSDDGQVEYADGKLADVSPQCGRVPESGLVTYYRLADRSRAKKTSVGVPSIHMPRWASRLTLDITDVSVQRLQDISDADAFAEGIQTSVNDGLLDDGTARGAYRALWESINGAGSWDANPWVWAISFRRAP